MSSSVWYHHYYSGPHILSESTGQLLPDAQVRSQHIFTASLPNVVFEQQALNREIVCEKNIEKTKKKIVSDIVSTFFVAFSFDHNAGDQRIIIIIYCYFAGK